MLLLSSIYWELLSSAVVLDYWLCLDKLPVYKKEQVFSNTA